MHGSSIPRGLLLRLRPSRTSEVFLSHADRCWKAEEANAARFASHTQMLTAIDIGLITVVTAGTARLLEAPSQAAIMRVETGWGYVARAILVVMLGRVLWLLYDSLRTLHPSVESRNRVTESALASTQILPGATASQKLALPDDVVAGAGKMMDEVAFVVFEATYKSYLDLHVRNSFRSQEIRAGRDAIFHALRWIIAVLFVYFVYAVVAEVLIWPPGQAFSRSPK